MGGKLVAGDVPVEEDGEDVAAPALRRAFMAPSTVAVRAVVEDAV